MPDRELSNALSSGEINNMQIGGTGTPEKVLTQLEIDTKLTSYVKADGTVPQTKALLSPQMANPSHQEGNLFYDDNEKLPSIQTDIPGVNFNLPSEVPMRVINKTGVTITNGMACRHDGVDITSGRPRIALALADSFINATILGVSTHDILNDTEGWIVQLGRIKDIDTSGHAVGVPMYLSDTIPGTWSATAPAIASQVGGVTVDDATVGVLQVQINNNIQLPTLVGVMQGQNSPVYPVTTTAQAILDYVVSTTFGMNVSIAAGTIDIPVTGLWVGSFTAGLSFPSTTSTRTIYIEIYETVGLTVVFPYPVNVPRDATEQGVSFTSEFDAVAGQTYNMRIRASTSISVTIANASMSIKSVRLN